MRGERLEQVGALGGQGGLGVSVRTLRRDVDRLWELGYPVEASRGVDGGYALAPGAALPPLVLDDDEAVALALGLQSAAGSAVAGMAETSVRALAKVVQVMTARLRRRVEALRSATVSGWGPAPAATAVDPAVLTTVALACRDAERTAFGYTPPGRERTERPVEPHRLVVLGRRRYLVGWDLDRGNWRVSASTGSTPRAVPAPSSPRAGSRPTTPRRTCGSGSAVRGAGSWWRRWWPRPRSGCATGSARGPR